jgi:hypothetical protein
MNSVRVFIGTYEDWKELMAKVERLGLDPRGVTVGTIPDILAFEE